MKQSIAYTVVSNRLTGWQISSFKSVNVLNVAIMKRDNYLVVLKSNNI